MQYELKAYRSPEGVTVLQLVAADVADARQQAESMGYRVISMRRRFHWALELGGLKVRQHFSVALFSQELLAATGVMWSQMQQREKERDLLFIGNEFRKAITTYYEQTPGTVKRYPNSLNDLLKDNRQLATVRHLRRIYRDPMTASFEWGIVRATDGGVMGIYSLSNKSTIKRSGFLQRDAAFEKQTRYVDWQFVYKP